MFTDLLLAHWQAISLSILALSGWFYWAREDCWVSKLICDSVASFFRASYRAFLGAAAIVRFCNRAFWFVCRVSWAILALGDRIANWALTRAFGPCKGTWLPNSHEPAPQAIPCGQR